MSEGPLCRQQIIRKVIFFGGNCSGENCPGSIIFGTIVRGAISRGTITRAQLSGRGGVIVLGGNCPGGNYPGGNFSRAQLSRRRFNIIKKCFGVLCEPLIYLFQLSVEKGVFPDNLKIAKVTPIYKAGDNSDISNYRPISVLPCFSKILERLMYNCLYKYLKENNILYEKQFGFQSGYSTSNAIVQFVDKIFDSFEKEQFTLGVFIDLSEAFDTVDHSLLLKKLKLYGITDKNLTWFESYLSNRKQYIEIGENSKTYLKYVTCGVPQGSILGSLLFLVYVNDLPNAFRLLDPITFADDTSLFFNHKDIKHLFTVVNNDLVNIKDWFTANKLSLNVEKTKYSFFHKPSKKNNIPSSPTKLIINNYEIQREESIKFLGVLLD